MRLSAWRRRVTAVFSRGRTAASAGTASADAVRSGSARARFAAWRTGRPFWGSVLVILAGIELFFSGQLNLGDIQIQFGIEGFQATIIPAVIILLGLMILFQPLHRVFYGIIELALALYAIIGVNLGGFFVGMLLGVVGGIVAVSWVPKPQPAAVESGDAGNVASLDEERKTRGTDGRARARTLPEPPPFRSAPARGGADQGRPALTAAARSRSVLALAAVVALGSVGMGAAPAQAESASSAPSGACLLGLLGDCSPTPTGSPSPSPTTSSSPSSSPSPSSSSATPTAPGLGGGSAPSSIPVPPIAPIPTSSSPSDTGTAPSGPGSTGDGDPTGSPSNTGGTGPSASLGSAPSTSDPTAPNDQPVPQPSGNLGNTEFATFSGDLTGQEIVINGLTGLGPAVLASADGPRPALEIDCGDLIINGFSLVVDHNGFTLDSTADTMELKGDVKVFVTSLSVDIGGVLKTFTAADPPTSATGLLDMKDAHIALAGVFAGGMFFTNLDQVVS